MASAGGHHMSVPGLGDVDLTAVREQLSLLGHDVPDSVIQSFLSEMAAGGGLEALAPPPEGAEGYGSESDGYASGVEVEDERDFHTVPYEEAYYGQHDRHLWAEPEDGVLEEDFGRENSPDHSYSIDEEDNLDHYFNDLQISRDSMRKPMEVKNVWVKPQGGQSAQTRPRTPSIGAHDTENVLQTDAPGLGSVAHGVKVIKSIRPERPAARPARPASARPAPRDWDDSPLVQQPLTATKRTAGHTPFRRPITAAPRPASTNSSFIVNTKSVRVARQGPKKVDRVARNRAMADAWGQDRFLKNGGAGKTASRPSMNFHQYFSEQHAADAKERSEGKKAARASTVRSLNSGHRAPQEKRRDGLRFKVRSRMQS